MRISAFAWSVLVACVCAVGCGENSSKQTSAAAGGAEGQRQVVIYYSADEVIARPILDAFEKESGVRVLGVPDTEATKNTGLVQRLRAERSSPRADVFWSGEVFLTIRLGAEGLLEAHDSPVARDRPVRLIGNAGVWHGFAQRARVLVYHTGRVSKERAPQNMVDLMSPDWRGRVGMARPQFGTTRGHMAALVALWGAPNAGSWMSSMRANGVRMYDGNSSVVQAVASGEIDVGLTDTDDVWAGQRNGWPVGLVYIRHDLPSGARAGPLVIPNTVALVKGGPNSGAARLLVDHLLSSDTERALARSESRNIPSNPSVAAEFPELAVEDPAWAPLEEIAAAMDEAMRLCGETLGE